MKQQLPMQTLILIVLFSWTAILTSCGSNGAQEHSHISQSTENPNMNPCTTTLTQFLKKDFTQWKGLSPECTISAMEQEFELYPDSGRWFVGREIKEAFWRRWIQKSYEDVVHVWYRGDELLKIAVEFPELEQTPQELTADWGEPKKENYWWGLFMVQEGEWVFAEKGIALRLNPEISMIVELIVFKPMSHEAYMNDIYFSEQAEEFPIDDDY